MTPIKIKVGESEGKTQHRPTYFTRGLKLAPGGKEAQAKKGLSQQGELEGRSGVYGRTRKRKPSISSRGGNLKELTCRKPTIKVRTRIERKGQEAG